ncbi:MAG: hypothetical protein Tsb0034_26610 [Ekhidna sp.]
MKKTLIYLLFLSLIFSCAENEQITLKITEPTEGYVEFNFLPKKTQDFIQALAIQPNGRIASSQGTIETDRVLVDFNENDSTTSYTLMIKNENNNKVENLVIYDNNNSVKAYVFEYVPNQEWHSEFQAQNQTFLNYTGEVNIYSYADDELINSFEFEEGEGIVTEGSSNGRTNCYELVQMNYYIMDGYLYYTILCSSSLVVELVEEVILEIQDIMETEEVMMATHLVVMEILEEAEAEAVLQELWVLMRTV